MHHVSKAIAAFVATLPDESRQKLIQAQDREVAEQVGWSSLYPFELDRRARNAAQQMKAARDAELYADMKRILHGDERTPEQVLCDIRRNRALR